MKKIILIIVLAFAACTMPVQEKGAGFFKNDAEEKYVGFYRRHNRHLD